MKWASSSSHSHFIFLRWKGAKVGDSARRAKTKSKEIPDLNDAEICLEGICWDSRIIDLKAKIENEYGVPIHHQIMTIQSRVPFYAKGTELNESTTLKDLRCILGSMPTIRHQASTYSKDLSKVLHILTKLKRDGARKAEGNEIEYLLKKMNVYLQRMQCCPIYPGLLFSCTQPTKEQRRLTSPPPSIHDVAMACMANSSSVTFKSSSSTVPKPKFNSFSNRHDREHKHDNGGGSGDGIALIEQHAYAKYRLRQRNTVKLFYERVLHIDKSCETVDTIILRTRYPSYEYQPGGRYCSWKRYICSFFSTTNLYAFFFLLLIVIFAVILWHVPLYEPPKIRQKTFLLSDDEMNDILLSSIQENETCTDDANNNNIHIIKSTTTFHDDQHPE